jgi:hypothetical protein
MSETLWAKQSPSRVHKPAEAVKAQPVKKAAKKAKKA